LLQVEYRSHFMWNVDFVIGVATANHAIEWKNTLISFTV